MSVSHDKIFVLIRVERMHVVSLHLQFYELAEVKDGFIFEIEFEVLVYHPNNLRPNYTSSSVYAFPPSMRTCLLKFPEQVFLRLLAILVSG